MQNPDSLCIFHCYEAFYFLFYLSLKLLFLNHLFLLMMYDTFYSVYFYMPIFISKHIVICIEVIQSEPPLLHIFSLLWPCEQTVNF